MPKYDQPNLMFLDTHLDLLSGKLKEPPDGLFRLHDVKPGPRLEKLKERARIFVAWVDSRFPEGRFAGLLAAAVVDPHLLERELTRFAKQLLELAPVLPRSEQQKVQQDLARQREARRCGASKRRDTQNPLVSDIAKEISWQLQAVLHIGPLLWGVDDSALIGLASADDSESILDYWAKAFVYYATPGTGTDMRKALSRFRTQGEKRSRSRSGKTVDAGSPTHDDRVFRRAWHFALQDAMRMAVMDFYRFVVEEGYHRGRPGTSVVQRKFTSSCRYVRKLAQDRRQLRADSWMKATGWLLKNGRAWIDTEMTHHVKRNKRNPRQISIKRKLAFIGQYATLMQGSWQIASILTQVKYLRRICELIIGVDEPPLKPAGRRKQTKDHQRFAQELAAMDRLVLREGTRNDWSAALGDNGRAIGGFIAEVVTPSTSGKAQTAPWFSGEYIKTFRKFWASAGNNNDDSLEDVFVNHCLVPLQQLGLAAQVPDDLSRRASELEVAFREKGDLKEIKPLKTHVGKKWTLNPFGIVLANEA